MATPAEFKHSTVLLDEAVDALVTSPDGIYVDGTFGRGGHSRLILQQLAPQGRLVASMLQAMGFDPEAVYIAAALPRYEVVPDWAALGRDGLGEVLRHHLALAAPERLIVLGRDVSPLLRHDWTQPAPAVDEISIQARKLPVMTSFSPARLLEQPGLRKRLWQQWLEWSERDMG